MIKIERANMKWSKSEIVMNAGASYLPKKNYDKVFGLEVSKCMQLWTWLPQGSYSRLDILVDHDWIRVVKRLNQVGLFRRFLRATNENKSILTFIWKSDRSHVIQPAKLSFDLNFKRKFMIEAKTIWKSANWRPQPCWRTFWRVKGPSNIRGFVHGLLDVCGHVHGPPATLVTKLRNELLKVLFVQRK